MKLIFAACAFLLAVPAVRADIDPSLREDGVLYFEDNLPDRVVGTVKAPTTVYTRRDFQSPLASLFTGQQLVLVGMSPVGYVVSATYRNNSITGWIMPASLPPDIDPALIATAKKNQRHRNEMTAAIARKQVLRGMTTDEVHQSLGNPDQTSSHTDDSGTSQQWTYTTYENVYQTSYVAGLYGRPVLQTLPTRVPVGQTIVTFTDGAVSAIEQHRSNAASAGARSY